MYTVFDVCTYLDDALRPLAVGHAGLHDLRSVRM